MAPRLLKYHWLSEFYYLNYLINKKGLKKTKNTIKLSKFDLICGTFKSLTQMTFKYTANLVFGVRVPLRTKLPNIKKGLQTK